MECVKCGKPISLGEPYHIGEAGEYYHMSCWEATMTKPKALTQIENAGMEMIADSLVTDILIKELMTKFSGLVTEFGITADEIREILKSRIRGW